MFENNDKKNIEESKKESVYKMDIEQINDFTREYLLYQADSQERGELY